MRIFMENPNARFTFLLKIPNNLEKNIEIAMFLI
ncbi:hypothetical protein SAMN04488569_103422 [Marinilactibacillus piezotolerans]|uniref:Uncharacterized protein n=1 Tax=Marinilactibacillus piezotolerans TaxID=258723 RepID=A0A1I3ZIY3_9LACT|nr:hypothetical protein SAMN04488569_103422 [Marinilactibacillus piezotolerans]